MTTEQLIDILKQYPNHLVTLHINADGDSLKKHTLLLGDIGVYYPEDGFKKRRKILWIKDRLDEHDKRVTYPYKIIEVRND